MKSVQVQGGLFDEAEDRRASDAAEVLTLNGGDLESLLDMSDALTPCQTPERIDSREFTKDSLFDGDATFPLEDPTHEAFLTRISEGGKAMLAYLECVSSRCSKKSAAEQASRLLRRPVYRARLRVLIQGRKGRAKVEEGAKALTKEGLMAELQGIGFNVAASPSERRAALIDLAKLRGWMKGDGEDARAGLPDPALLMDYLRTAEEQGIDPVEGARAGAPPGAGVGDSGQVSEAENGVGAQDVVVG